MQQTLTLSFSVPFAAVAQEPSFTVPTQEPNSAGSFQLPTPTGGIPPWTFSVPAVVPPGLPNAGQPNALPTGWSCSTSGLLSWTSAAAAAAAGTNVNPGVIQITDSGT